MKKVFLYGGCVIRDAHRNVQDEIELSGYVARQSLISAMNPPSVSLPNVRMQSKFQERMANGDISSNLVAKLRGVAAETDLVVMDTHIERLGVHKLPDGSFLTPSAEIRASGILETIDGLRSPIDPGTERHTRFYRNAVRKFTIHLEKLGLKERVIVINAPWAIQDTDGVPFNTYRGIDIPVMSSHMESLCRILEEAGISVRDMPEELAIAPVHHQWGRGPYHFGVEAMDWVAEQIRSSI